MSKSKKGQITGPWAALLSTAAGVVIIGAFLAYSADVQLDIRQDFGDAACTTSPYTRYVADTNLCWNGTTNSIAASGNALNVTTDALAATKTVAGKQNTVAKIAVFSVVIGLLFGVAGYLFAKRQ